MGPFWGYSEAIPNGKPFRVGGDHERKPIPKVTQGDFKGAKGGQRDPLDPKGPKGNQGDPRGSMGPKGAFGALGGDGPMGPFGVIPKPFRMECHFEWMVITK